MTTREFKKANHYFAYNLRMCGNCAHFKTRGTKCFIPFSNETMQPCSCHAPAGRRTNMTNAYMVCDRWEESK